MNAYEEPGQPRWLRALHASFRIGRWYGTEVRMFWVAAILMPLLMWSWLGSVGGFGERLLLTAVLFVGLYSAVLTHEFGHALWARRYGIHTPQITLSPLGGVAHLGAPVRGPREELLVSLAGPAVHLLWLAVVWPLSGLLPWGTVELDGFAYDPVAFTLAYLWQLHVGLLLFNLLPFFPMDGGRVLRALLAMRMHPNRATRIATTIGIGGAVLLIGLGLFAPGYQGSIQVFLGLSNLMACLQERMVARHQLVYGEDGPPREAWQSDPDAWKRGADPFADHAAPARPGWWSRWRWRRDPAVAAQRKAAARAALDAELDRVLDRVRQVGLSGLSGKERAVLERASRERRGTG